MIIREIACLAHSHRVKKPVVVRAFGSKLTATVFAIATGAHILERNHDIIKN